jgi:hypothetical protein
VSYLLETFSRFKPRNIIKFHGRWKATSSRSRTLCSSSLTFPSPPVLSSYTCPVFPPQHTHYASSKYLSLSHPVTALSHS